MAGGGERQHVVHDLGRIGGIVHQRLGADGDLVAEDAGDLVRVAGAADIAQQRDPVDGFPQLPVEASLLAQRGGQQARAQLRLQRLAERVVLREREGRDELRGTQKTTARTICPDGGLRVL